MRRRARLAAFAGAAWLAMLPGRVARAEPAAPPPPLAIAAGQPLPAGLTGTAPPDGTLAALDFAAPLPPEDLTVPPGSPGWHLLAVLPPSGPPRLHLLAGDGTPARPVGDGGLRREDALRTAPGDVWEGTVPARGSRWFRLESRRRQPVWIDVLAARAGSSLDPFVRILDDDGGEPASVDDVPGFGPDLVLPHIVPRRGGCWIEIRDTRNEGGKEHRFRLGIRTAPVDPAPWRLVGSAPGEGAHQTAEGDRILRPGIPLRDSFHHAGATNRYRIDGSAGLRLSIRFTSRRIGSFADPVARLEDDAGRLLTGIEASGNHGDGLLTHRFEHAGTAWLQVWEASGLHGHGFDYRIEPIPTDRVLELTAEPALLQLSAGAGAEVKVRVSRKRHDLPVRLRLEGLPAGARLEDAEVPAGRREHTCRVVLDAGVPAASVTPVRLVGSVGDAGGGEAVLESDADFTEAWRKVWPGLLHPPAPLPGRLVVAIRPDQARP